jgi:hypothetical protein
MRGMLVIARRGDLAAGHAPLNPLECHGGIDLNDERGAAKQSLLTISSTPSRGA